MNKARSDTWWLYALRCQRGVYVGIALDPVGRWKLHLARSGSLYTQMNIPLGLLWAIELGDGTAARKTERYCKRLTHAEKIALAANPIWGSTHRRISIAEATERFGAAPAMCEPSAIFLSMR